MVLVFFVLAIYFKLKLDSVEDVSANTYALLYASATAIIGWVIASIINANTSRKQHTVNVILGMQYSEVHKNNVDRFLKAFPSGKKITLDDIKSNTEETGKNLDAARYLLNHLEFVAAGIKTRDLHHNLLKQTLRGHMCSLYSRSEAYIKHARGENREGQPERPLVYEHLTNLYNVWKR